MSVIGSAGEFLERKFRHEVRAHHVLEAQGGEFVPYPQTLAPKLRETLESRGIRALYSHQEAAFHHITDNKDCVLVSHTASGKTLAFLLPILNEYLSNPARFSVLLLYPTKALSRDQESTLGKLLRVAGAEMRFGTFDGDTPREDRARIARTADFVITNPDMLHAGFLPNHNRRWKGFLSRLRYVVVDEVHTYRGAFGSHVANVFRRLLRVCKMHGSRPTFVCSSATVGNPGRHVEALFQRPFQVVEKDGAPKARRDLYLVNPPLVETHGHALYRKGPGAVTVPLIRYATKHRIRTICFCRARQEVERLYKAVIDRNPDLASHVKPYRGGLLPNERRSLERQLVEGSLTTIITTNALELGIDIGELELCILSGHPGSCASFWQQAGRVGRKEKSAMIVFVAKNAPIDQYLVHHPEFITHAPIEQAWLSADNPYIALQHIPCAAYEHPLRSEEPLFSPAVYTRAVEILRRDGTLKPYREYQRYAREEYPARGVNLRGMTDYNIDIYHGTEVIGELDPIGARGTLYKDAIYQHLGKRYMSCDLDLDRKLCQVTEVEVDYYTEAVWENQISMTEVDERKNLHGCHVEFGAVRVIKQTKLYKKIRERTFENVGYGPITLEPFEYDTTGFSFYPAAHWQDALKKVDTRYIEAALYGLSYILKHVGPSVCMGDSGDIDTDVSLSEDRPGAWRSALYVFDTVEGGVGYAEKIYEQLVPAFRLCREIIEECECDAGCPSCVPPLPPGVENEELEQFFVESNAAVACCQSLLWWVEKEQLVLPEVRVDRGELKMTVCPAEEDPASVKLTARLERAANVLEKKRARTH